MLPAAVADSTPKIYFLDLEVDKVPVDKGEPRRCITQIAIYDPSREEGKRWFNAYVSPPKQLRYKPEEISFQGPPKHEFSVVWPHVKAFINEGLDGNRFAVIVGHKMYKHDWPILEAECASIQEALPKYWKPFCSLYLSSAIGIPKGEQSLASLCQRYNVKHLPQHNAKNDVQMTVNVFGKMVEGSDLKKIANAMILPPKDHPVREVANIIRSVQEAVMVFFDFESTGLFPKEGEEGDNPRATELGAYIPSKNARFSSLIDPGLDEGITLSEIVVQKTHITEQMIREAAQDYEKRTSKKMNFKAVWMDFEAFMEHEIGPTVKKVIVLAGHNIWNYDMRLYKSECERFGMKHIFWKSVDTCVLSRHLYKGLSPQPKGFHSLEGLGKRLEVVHVDAHRALGDVLANAAIWDKFVAGIDKKKLNGAVLSKHPIYSLGHLVRNEGGTFIPSNFMVDKNVQPLISDALQERRPEVADRSELVRSSPIMPSDEIEEPFVFNPPPIQATPIIPLQSTPTLVIPSYSSLASVIPDSSTLPPVIPIPRPLVPLVRRRITQQVPTIPSSEELRSSFPNRSSESVDRVTQEEAPARSRKIKSEFNFGDFTLKISVYKANKRARAEDTSSDGTDSELAPSQSKKRRKQIAPNPAPAQQPNPPAVNPATQPHAIPAPVARGVSGATAEDPMDLVRPEGARQEGESRRFSLHFKS